MLFDKIRQQMSSKGKRSIDARAQHGRYLSMTGDMEMVVLVVLIDQVDPSACDT